MGEKPLISWKYMANKLLISCHLGLSLVGPKTEIQEPVRQENDSLKKKIYGEKCREIPQISLFSRHFFFLVAESFSYISLYSWFLSSGRKIKYIWNINQFSRLITCDSLFSFGPSPWKRVQNKRSWLWFSLGDHLYDPWVQPGERLRQLNVGSRDDAWKLG